MNQYNLTKRQIVFIMIGTMITLLLGALDSTIVGTAMPKIINDLKGIEHYSWPFTAYILCSTVAIIIFGKLSDIFGRKPIFLTGIVTFLVSSMLCGLSQNMIQLIVFRGLQGIGGGVLISNSFIIVGDLFSSRERGKYMGILSSMFGLSSVIGPTIGGFITDALNWRWVFYVNLPLGLLSILAVLFFLPNFKDSNEKKPFDYSGAALLLIGLVPLFLAFTWAGTTYSWTSPQILGMLAFSVVIFLVLAFVEKRAADPVLHPQLFRNGTFRASAVAGFISNAAMFAGILYIPLFVQGVLGKSATSSGVITTPMMLSLTVASILAGQIVSRSGHYKWVGVSGFLVTAAGFICLSTLTPSSSSGTVLFFSALLGIGSGIVMPVINVSAQNAFPHKQLGQVTSSVQFFRNMGATIGSSVFGYIVTSGLTKGFKTMDLSQVPEQFRKIVATPQILMNATALDQIKTHIPPVMIPVFDKILDGAKSIMTNSLHTVFFVGVCITAFALLVSIFMKEIPLHTHDAVVREFVSDAECEEEEEAEASSRN